MKKYLFTVLGLIIVLALNSSAAQIRVKQDATGAGDGSSWVDAYTDIQAAITASTAGDEIWIAAGVYVYPKGTRVVVDKNLSIYGGFAGVSEDETVASRDYDENQTILSGDSNTNAVWIHHVPDFENFTETTTTTTLPLIVGNKANIPMAFDNDFDYYSPTTEATDGGQKMLLVNDNISAVIDGLWFVGANADGNGNGVLHIGKAGAGSAVRNIRMVGCYNNAHNTAALFHGGTKMTIENCDFYYLKNPIGHGSAIYQSNAPEVITGCSFFGISAAICGSIVESRGGKLWMTNNVATRCVTTTSWGGNAYGGQCLLLSQGGTDAVVISGLVMTNCGSIVTAVSGVNTVPPLIRRSGNYSVEDSYFGNNRMSFAIGANKTYSMFMPDDGGGESSSPGVFKNVTFADNVVKARPIQNSVGQAAIGIVGGPHTPQTLVNCTFLDNQAIGFEGDLTCYASKGVVSTTFANPNYNGIGVANSTFIGDNNAPDVLLVNPRKDNFVNVVNSIFKNKLDEDANDSLRVVGNFAANPLNLINSSVNAMDVVPDDVNAVELEIDTILFEQEEKTVAAGSIPVFRAASSSGGVTNGADVAAHATGFAYKLAGESAPWQQLNAAQTGTITPVGPIADALNANRTYGSFTRGALQGLSTAAEAGHTLVVRKVTRSAGAVTPIVQVVPLEQAIASITATPDAELSGITFLGWYSDAACDTGSLISSDNPLTSANLQISEDTIIYAKFDIPASDITIDLGDYAEFGDSTSTKVLSLTGGAVLEIPPYTMNAGYFDEGFEGLPLYVPYTNATYTLKAVSKSIRVVHVVMPSDLPVGSDNSGSSWENATTDLQAAINEAGRYRGEVWVKQGTYIPPASGYFLKANVEIVGGFAGTETTREAADPEANPTIFSGDVMDDSFWQILNSTKNGFVNTSPAERVWLDGQFNLTDEMLDQYTILLPAGNSYYNIGRGFYIDGATNTAFSGLTLTLFRYAAIEDSTGNSGRLKIENCKFLANITENTSIYKTISLDKAGTWIEISDTEFLGNGRCISVNTTSPDPVNRFKNLRFYGTYLNNFGCIALSGSKTSFIIEDCVFARGFTANTANAIYLASADEASVALIRNCDFSNNISVAAGQGVIVAANSAYAAAPYGAVRIENSRFISNTYDSLTSDNELPHSACIVNQHNANLQLDGCYFAENAMIVTNGAKAALCGTIFSSSTYNGATLFVNCTFEKNRANEINLAGSSLVKVGTFAVKSAMRLALAHCIVTDSEFASGIPEFMVHSKGNNQTFSLINTIARNDAVNYIPIEHVSPGVGYAPNIISSALKGFDSMAWANTTYSVVTNVSAANAQLARRLYINPDRSVLMRSVAATSPFVRGGQNIYRHTDGKYYIYLSELSAVNPWRRIDSLTDTLTAATIDIETAMPIDDAFGNSRQSGKIAYGPLNAAASPTLILFR